MAEASAIDDSPHSPDSTTSALTLSFFAGMSTCLGAAVAFCYNRDKRTLHHGHLAFSLALAGSVMMTVSISSILPEAFASSNTGNDMLPPTSLAFWERCLAFCLGSVLYVLLSKCAFPEPEEILGFDDDPSDLTLPLIETSLDREISEDPTTRIDGTGNLTARKSNLVGAPPTSQQQSVEDHHDQYYSSKSMKYQSIEAQRNWRVAILLFVSLAVHNFPEGLAVAASSMHSSQLGWTTTAAIALHNIPEGIAIAIPCLAARPDAPWLAFGLASVSGLAEPLGALVALALLPSTDQHDATGSSNDAASFSWDIENVLAFVAGIMIMVSIVELFPEARRNMKTHRWPGVSGAVIGVIVMLASDAYLDG